MGLVVCVEYQYGITVRASRPPPPIVHRAPLRLGAWPCFRAATQRPPSTAAPTFGIVFTVYWLRFCGEGPAPATALKSEASGPGRSTWGEPLPWQTRATQHCTRCASERSAWFCTCFPTVCRGTSEQWQWLARTLPSACFAMDLCCRTASVGSVIY